MPVAIAASTSRLARAGLLVTRADAVESLAQVDTLVIDKTGTLTGGDARLTDIDARPGWDAGSVLRIAAALEADSLHPTASAVRAAAATLVDPNAATTVCADAREIAGQGIEGHVDGVRWRIGRPDWVAALADADDWRGEGDIALGSASGVVAFLTIADELRADAHATISDLRALGLEVELASGDREVAVRGAARQLGIETARGRLRPEDKLGVVRALQARGRRVLMVGDGINDGPVLAAADVSAAMGRGSGIAHAASDLLLLRDSLAALPTGIRVARRTLVIIGQNLRWAAGYNIAAVPLAALGLMPPWVAALGMSLSSLLVVANARRLARDPGDDR
ncbi:MAG: HAD-IC family P-type ATPase [Steroidobacteraceae bacterium]